MTLLLFASSFLACLVLNPDRDGDGHGYATDCNDSDATIYPSNGANEVPGDGVDSDCDGQDPTHSFVGAWRPYTLSLYDEGSTPEDTRIDLQRRSSLEITEGLGARLDMAWEEGGSEFIFALQSDQVLPLDAGGFELTLLGRSDEYDLNEEEGDTGLGEAVFLAGVELKLSCQAPEETPCTGRMTLEGDRFDVEMELER